MATTDSKRENKPVVREVEERDLNPDPITGAPGSHPTGAGIGAASGGLTGAALGAIGGPIGAVIGAIVGGVTGGYAGKGIGEAVDPTEDDEYWRKEHANRPYGAERPYEDYQPAYTYGSTIGHHAALSGEDSFDTYENRAREHWDKVRGDSDLEWDDARPAVRDAYDRRFAASRKSSKM